MTSLTSLHSFPCSTTPRLTFSLPLRNRLCSYSSQTPILIDFCPSFEPLFAFSVIAARQAVQKLYSKLNGPYNILEVSRHRQRQALISEIVQNRIRKTISHDRKKYSLIWAICYILWEVGSYFEVFWVVQSEMEENELHLSSVIEVSSPWKEKASGSFLSKIVKMDNDTRAIILQENSNKALRFLYLSFLMGKKNVNNMQNLIAKLGQIKINRGELCIKNIPATVSRILPNSVEGLHAEMHQLAKKMENHGYTHNAILKLSHEFALIDPLLIASLRTVAEDYKMSHALDWNTSIGLGQTEALMGKVTMQKGPSGLSGRNKYVLFYPLTELEIQFFRNKGVSIAKESECLQELSDNQNLKYQDYLMIEKVYSLL